MLIQKLIVILLDTKEQEMSNSSNNRVKVQLDIGGKLFSASKQSLMSMENTYFYGLLANSEKFKTNENGEFFVDRDPLVFDRILNYLRTGKMDIRDLTSYMLDILKDDLDYYCIPLPIELQPIPIIPSLMWNENNKSNQCTFSNNNLTVTKTSGDNYYFNCGVIGNIAVDKFTVRIDERGTVDGNIMLGFTTGDDWDPNGNNYNTKGWFVHTGLGVLFGIGNGYPYASKIKNNGDYITVIREGNTIRFEKNKINLGICPGFKNIPNQSLFPAVDMGDLNCSVTLVNDY